MHKIKWLLCLAMVFIITGCTPVAPEQKSETPKEYSRSEFVVGTIVSIKIFEDGSEEILDEIFSRLTEIEARMSFNSEQSEVKDVNAGAGVVPVTVSADTFDVVSSAVEFAEKSKGLFDPTIGPLVQLWGIGSEGAAIPSDQDRENAIQLIDWKQVELNGYENSIYLKTEKMEIDLGAIAKGYASDEVVRILKENNVKRGIINLGGNVYAYGEKPDGSAWRIGVQNPFSNRGEYIGIVEIKNKSVVTSGIYERYFEEDGVRYHHILNSQTGFPVNNELASVTIFSEHSIDADALSTILFAAGIEQGKMFLETYYPDVEAIFITMDKLVYTTDLSSYNLEWTDSTFKLQP